MTRKDEPRSSLARLIDGRRAAVASLALTSFLGGLSEALFLVVITRAAFAITEGQSHVGVVAGRSLSISSIVLLSLALVLIRLALSFLSTWQGAKLSNDVVSVMRKDLCGGFLRSSWSLQQDERGGRLQDLLTTFVGNGAVLINSVTTCVTSGFSLIALLGLAVAVDPAGAGVVVLALMVLSSVLRPVRGMVRRKAQETAVEGMNFATSLNEIAGLGMEVHIFNVQPQAETRITELIDRNTRVNERLTFLRGVVPNLYSGMAYGALIGAVWFVSSSSSASFGTLGAVMLLMLRSLSYGQGLQSAITGISSTVPFVESLDKQLKVYQLAAIIDFGDQVGEVGTLSLESVSFSYGEGEPVLNDIHLAIQPREIIGIVGPSGSGKSTLVQLMLGLRTPTAGRVLADGREVGRFSKQEWARKVTFVPQSPHLVAGTVADNIRFLRTNISDEAVEQAARLAHVHEEVEAWPQGYLRDVGENGGHLSGGQQQRICIARALVEHPDVIILDEPTSSLDVRSESLIRETLSELSDVMTVVVIAHRMSTLEICDRILVIQDGRMRGFDTPANLERSSAFYREALELSGLR